MTKEQTRNLLIDFIQFHSKEKNIDDSSYFKLKASAKKYSEKVTQ